MTMRTLAIGAVVLVVIAAAVVFGLIVYWQAQPNYT